MNKVGKLYACKPSTDRIAGNIYWGIGITYPTLPLKSVVYPPRFSFQQGFGAFISSMPARWSISAVSPIKNHTYWWFRTGIHSFFRK